jgi:DNA-binding transcriptional LysR family regulator
VALFDRQQTRKPTLTQAGGAVLAKARAVAIGVDDLRAIVKGFLQGFGGRGHACGGMASFSAMYTGHKP